MASIQPRTSRPKFADTNTLSNQPPPLGQKYRSVHVHDFVPHEDSGVCGHGHLRVCGGRELDEAEPPRKPALVALHQAAERTELLESNLELLIGAIVRKSTDL